MPVPGDVRLTSTHGGAEAERRQLTVLFCDLVDSTPLSQDLDAEAFRELLLAYQAAVAEVVDRYEGQVAQYLGDGVLVYFGHPAAHEDDAERAVRASFDMLQAIKPLNPPVHTRIGIHTGNVVIGQVGARHDMLAMGDTTNIASRIHCLAAPDTVLCSQSTLKLVPGLFIAKALGTHSLKGVHQPMNLHQVVQPSGVRSRLEAAERLTPFVGRESELALLDERWRQAQAGQGQAVLIRGEPGLGKSRLLLMMHARLQDSAHTWLECRASPMNQQSTFQPFVELLHRGLQLKDGANEVTKLRRLEEALDRIGLDKFDAVPLLAPLLNFVPSMPYAPSPYGPELKRQKTMDYLNAWILALARQQPLVLVFEDLHWSDPSTLDLIARLVTQIPTASVLVVMAARPEFQPAWLRSGHLSLVCLKPLQDEHAALLLGRISEKPLPAAVSQRIQERANGVPLFLEEITKHILESGQLVESSERLELKGRLEDLAIPATLQDSLMARLDKQGDAKETAQVCAVIGREIAYKLLAHVTEQDDELLRTRLETLTNAELLYPRGTPPEATYTFKHALIRDTAYNSLLKSTRQKLHGRIAQVLEQHFPERARTEPALLAEHFEKANLIDQAVRYYKAAGDAGAARGAVAEARLFFERALDLLRSLPEDARRARVELTLLAAVAPWLAAAKGYAHQDVQSTLERARGLFADDSDPLTQAVVLIYSWGAHYFAGQHRRAAAFAEECERLGRKSGALYLALGQARAAFSYWQLGQLETALAYSEQAVQFTDEVAARAYGEVGGNDPIAYALFVRAWLRWFAGYPDEALALARRSAAHARTLGLPMPICHAAVLSVPAVLRYLRLAEEGLAACQATAALCERHGYAEGRMWTAAQMGVALGRLGRLDEALPLLRQSIELREHLGSVGWLTIDYTDMAAVCLERGRLAEAREAIGRAFECMEKTDERYWEAELHRVRGEWVLAHDAGGDEAEVCFRKALDISRAQGARSLELRAATSLARLWQQQDRKSDADALLRPIYDWFSEGFGMPDLHDAKALLDRL